MTDFAIIPIDGFRLIKTRLEDGTLKVSMRRDADFVHLLPDGADWRIINGRVIVAAPGVEPYFLNQDGSKETISFPSGGKVSDQDSQTDLNPDPQPVQVRRDREPVADDLHPGKVPE